MTQYAGIYLMFPLMFHYYHISLDAHCASPNGPNGPCANLDGLLEPRLLVSRNGVNFSYADGPNGREAFLQRGVGVRRPNVTGIFSGDFDAGVTAVARGIFEVGDQIVMIHQGWQYTHAGYANNKPGAPVPGGPVLSGLQRLTMRQDGFVSLSTADSTATASVRTVPLRLPSCEGAGSTLQLLLNLQTSVGGHLSLALLHAVNGSAVPGFGLEASQPMVGNFIGAPASWLRSGPRSAASSDLSALSGAAVRLQMEGRDFNLFSFWADCAPANSFKTDDNEYDFLYNH